MQLLILPGYNSGILAWAQEMKMRLTEHFDSIRIHQYQHWERDSAEFAWDYELDQILAHLESESDYGILALSIGTMLALKGVHERGLLPQFCVFLGTSVSPSEDPDYDLPSLVRDYAIPTLFIQETNDPAGSFSALKALFATSYQDQFRFIEVAGDDHWYADEADFVLIEGQLKSFLSRLEA